MLTRTIKVERYSGNSVEQRTGYAGTIEPETPSGAHPSWIIYFREDGSATLFTKREPDGAVIGQGRELPNVAHEHIALGELMEAELLPGTTFTVGSGNVTVNIYQGREREPMSDPATSDAVAE